MEIKKLTALHISVKTYFSETISLIIIKKKGEKKKEEKCKIMVQIEIMKTFQQYQIVFKKFQFFKR